MYKVDRYSSMVGGSNRIDGRVDRDRDRDRDSDSDSDNGDSSDRSTRSNRVVVID